MVAFFVQGGIALALIAFGALQKDGFVSDGRVHRAGVLVFLPVNRRCVVRAALSRADNRCGRSRFRCIRSCRSFSLATCGYLFYSSVTYAQSKQAVSIALYVMLAGLIVWGVLRLTRKRLTTSACSACRRSVLCCAAMQLLHAFKVMSLADWLALAVIFHRLDWLRDVCRTADRRSGSLLGIDQSLSLLWMMQTTSRENRVVDAVVVQNLSTSPSFFASTTILIIGGLLAVLGTQGASDLVKEFPFATVTRPSCST